MDEDTVTAWIKGLKGRDDKAAANLWDRYFRRLIALAKHRLGGFPKRVEDEEDVAISVFESLCQGAAAGRFTELTDRDDLWRLLVVVTTHKSTDAMRRAGRKKRGGGEVRGESVFITPDGSNGVDQIAGTDPTPELLAELEDAWQDLIGRLKDDNAKRVALLRMQGFSNEEMADKLDISISSVERKLRLIRQAWSQGIST